ncbi:cytochrome P450, partial [Streptomyces sp. NPDC059627]
MPLPTTTGCPHHVLDPTGSDIQGEGAALRAVGPAARVLLPGGIPAWSVTDPGLIRRLLVHPDISKDAHQHWPAYLEGRVPADWPLRIWVDVRNALTAYGAEHMRLRRPLAAAFGPRQVRALTPRIETVVRTLLDDLATAGPDVVVDLRARFAWPLPLLVGNTVLNVPADLHEPFRDAVGALFATDLSPDEAAAAPGRVYELVARLVEYKTRTPEDDITSRLVAARDQRAFGYGDLNYSCDQLSRSSDVKTVNLAL